MGEHGTVFIVSQINLQGTRKKGHFFYVAWSSLGRTLERVFSMTIAPYYCKAAFAHHLLESYSFPALLFGAAIESNVFLTPEDPSFSHFLVQPWTLSS